MDMSGATRMETRAVLGGAQRAPGHQPGLRHERRRMGRGIRAGAAPPWAARGVLVAGRGWGRTDRSYRC